MTSVPVLVPVYTVCDESRYLIVKNVPALGCIEELVKLFGSYGPIEEYRLMDEEDSEAFTDIYWIKFLKINNARFAKRKLDNFNFLGNLLQVSYAPNYETPLDTKEKLEDRRNVVLSRIRLQKRETSKQFTVSQQVGGVIPSLMPMNQVSQLPLENMGEAGQQVAKKTQYFPSVSMNSTVQTVRQKLNQISNSGLLSVGTSSNSNMSHAKQSAAEEHKIGVEAELKPVEKKPRLDNRRRI